MNKPRIPCLLRRIPMHEQNSTVQQKLKLFQISISSSGLLQLNFLQHGMNCDHGQMLVFCNKCPRAYNVLFNIIAMTLLMYYPVFIITHKHKIPHDMMLLMFVCIQKRKLPQERRKPIEHWMISEKASRSYNTTRIIFSNRKDLSSLWWWTM